MGNEMLHLPREALMAILLVYGSIEDADGGLLACQNSTFRQVVTLRQEAARDAYAAVRNAAIAPPEQGPLVPAATAEQLLSFGKALDNADAAYPDDQEGNRNYRDYLRSVHKAARVRDAMEEAKAALETGEAAEKHAETELRSSKRKQRSGAFPIGAG